MTMRNVALIIYYLHVAICLEGVWMQEGDGNYVDSPQQNRNCTGSSADSTEDCGIVKSSGGHSYSPGEALRQPCTLAEKKLAGCVRGQGECFVYIIGSQRKHACQCNERYVGIHCAELNFDRLFGASTSRTKVGLAAGITGGVVIVVALVVVLIKYRRKCPCNTDTDQPDSPRRNEHTVEQPDEPDGEHTVEQPDEPDGEAKELMKKNTNGHANTNGEDPGDEERGEAGQETA